MYCSCMYCDVCTVFCIYCGVYHACGMYHAVCDIMYIPWYGDYGMCILYQVCVFLLCVLWCVYHSVGIVVCTVVCNTVCVRLCVLWCVP